MHVGRSHHALRHRARVRTSARSQQVDAMVDVPGIGTVRVTAKRVGSKRGKSVDYFWTADVAVVVSR